MTEIKDTVRSCNRHLCKRKDHSSSLSHRRQRAQPREERRGSPTKRQMRVGPWWRGRVEAAWQVMAAPRCIVERGYPSPSGQPAARRLPPATARLYSLRPSAPPLLGRSTGTPPEIPLFCTAHSTIQLSFSSHRQHHVLLTPVSVSHQKV